MADALETSQRLKGPDMDYVYDLLGNLRQTRLPNGVVSDHVYDPLNRLLTLRHFHDDDGDGFLGRHTDAVTGPRAPDKPCFRGCAPTEIDYCSRNSRECAKVEQLLSGTACGLSIGGHELKARAFLAPMAGITDRPMRELAARYGAGLVVSEMIASAALTTYCDGGHRG